MTNQRDSKGSKDLPNPDGRGQVPPRGHRRPGRQNSANRGHGRNIYRNEDQQITLIWANLNENSRLRLIQRLVGMSNLSLSVSRGSDGPNPSTNVDGMEHAASTADGPTRANATQQEQQRRERVWERPILRDIPLFQAFSQMSPSERRRAVNGEWSVSQLMSIVTGVVARAFRLRRQAGSSEPTDEDIIARINENINDGAALRSLFTDAPPRDQGAQDNQQESAGSASQEVREGDPVQGNQDGEDGNVESNDPNDPPLADDHVENNAGGSSALSGSSIGNEVNQSRLQESASAQAAQVSGSTSVATAVTSSPLIISARRSPKQSWADMCESPSPSRNSTQGSTGASPGGDGPNGPPGDSTSSRRRTRKRKRRKRKPSSSP